MAVCIRVLAVLGILTFGASGRLRPIGLARADEPPDAPLPEITAREPAARVQAAWPAYRKGLLEIEFEAVTNTNWRSEQEPIMVRFPGRVRYQSDGA